MPTPNRTPGASEPDDDSTRGRERQRAAEHIADTLRQRGAVLTGSETPDELSELLSVVERFEAAVARRGGDSFVNTPASSAPEEREFVLPQRESGQSTRGYIARIAEAAEGLEQQGE